MQFTAYHIIIGISLVIILSYVFNLIAQKTNIPSVLMLIALGVAIKPLFSYFGIKILHNVDLMPVLEVVGIIGLIKIVLEAALDLKLRADKLSLILKALLVAFLGLILTTSGIAMLFYYALDMPVHQSVIYAIPLSVISSAIVIPSIGGLDEYRKEFLVYESAFSDILGIMLFTFYIESIELTSAIQVVAHISKNTILTIIIAIVVNYGLVLVFHKIQTHVKFFLLFSFLLLLYSFGKLYHLSPLLIILFFGLIINNHKLFFFGFMKRFVSDNIIEEVLEELKLMTAELAFLIRTFFFVIFGLSITIATIFNFEVLISSVVILAIIYLFRRMLFGAIERKKIKPGTYISPRGLITILLFFHIPKEYIYPEFNSGIFLLVIIMTGMIMTFALISYGKGEPVEITKEETSPDASLSSESADRSPMEK